MKSILNRYINKNICPLCKEEINENLGEHIKKNHGSEEFKKTVLIAKKSGMPDPEIGERFNLTFRQLERIITETYGINISILKRSKKIKYWEPKNFKEETGTVWSFEQRGDWATHDGRYRGNWSPYIPRNVILKFSKPGDTVLDYFVGGGTTAVEAKLLGRRCIARDINPSAIELTLENLEFNLPEKLFEEYPIYEPKVSKGDARNLSKISDKSIDLILAHPPYAGIINYSSKVKGDLSKLSIDGFLKEMKNVASESYRVLKPGKICAILIGDTRKHKFVVPIGFWTIRVFLDAGFVLKDLVIKRQHKCKTTGFWYDRSIKYNFLLLAHEYLPIFEKPEELTTAVNHYYKKGTCNYEILVKKQDRTKKENLESTTVWILPKENMEEEIKRNLIERFANSKNKHIEINFNNTDNKGLNKKLDYLSLAYIALPKKLNKENEISSYRLAIKKVVDEVSKFLAPDGFLVIDIKDVKIDELVHPMGVNLLEDMSLFSNFKIKEIIVVTPNNTENSANTPLIKNQLEIIHRYLLVFVHKKGDG